MKARKINTLVALVIAGALTVNALSTCNGWALVGDLFGWALIVGGLWMMVDNKLKERE